VILARQGRSQLRHALLAMLLLTSACSSAHSRGSTGRFAPTAPAPLPADAPYIVMIGPSAGWAVWPSSSSWVLLQTSDRFAHVTNRTPVAVETGGGLVGAFLPSRVAVAVGAHERLLRSPLLTWTGGTTWMPSELPDAVSDARGAVSIGSARLTAVTAAGVVVAETTTGWRRLTDSQALSPDGLHIDSVTWASSSLGWLTAHGNAGRPMAFGTSDGGATWMPVPDASGTSVAAFAPCRAGTSWLLPVVDLAGSITVLRTSDGGHSWERGDTLHVPAGEPAWGCHGNDVWMVGRAGHADHVFASGDDAATWADRGPAPTGLTDLTPTGGGVGFAASTGKHPTLWSVGSDGAKFTAVPLPGWVATIGGQPSGA